MLIRLSKYEQETIIVFNEAEDLAEVYTHNRPLIKKIDRLCEEYPNNFLVKRIDENNRTYTISKNLINIRKPTVMSKDAKEKRKLHMEILNERKGKKNEKKLRPWKTKKNKSRNGY